jgi:hypothetical protein
VVQQLFDQGATGSVGHDVNAGDGFVLGINVSELMVTTRMGRELRHVAETMSQPERFPVFSISVGVSRHAVSLCALVGTTQAHMGMYACGQYPSYVHLCLPLCIYECQLRAIVYV